MPRFLLTLFGLLLCLCGSGCVIVDVKVTNPIPGLSKVAVAPFFNLSDKPDVVVDSRRFALAYYAELQKVPGFQVVPVGVTEVALREYRLQMDDPQDVARLAHILNVDAVVVGAITDYDPYYPPRVGLDVEWISPFPWHFEPGVAVDPNARRSLLKRWKAERKRREKLEEAGLRPTEMSIRGQSVDSPSAIASAPPQFTRSGPIETTPGPTSPVFNPGSQSELLRQVPAAQGVRSAAPIGFPVQPMAIGGNSSATRIEAHTLMSYTRIFDGKDADLIAALRDYIELSGDARSGGWEAYLHRSEDFIRFTAHRMIEEMLVLHGGEGGRRIVFKLRKYK